MKPLAILAVLISLLGVSSCGGGGASGGGGGATPVTPPPPAPTGSYTVTAWSELGMHCIDGKDYSVFAVLPPYNVLHAQVVKRGDPPTTPTGVTVTYQAIADTTGSLNTTSSGKTNFWTYVQALFLTNPAVDVGLTGTPVQSNTPRAMIYNNSLGNWEAVGIPTIPYDDNGVRNPYPMAKVVVKDASGNILATTTTVLSVSDEMTCSTCHASGSNAAAQPAAGWENNADPAKDVKLNILKKHDDRWTISGYLPALAANGYHYQSSLYQTAVSGTPILCAACHATNALGAAGVTGVNPLTADMHTLHGPVINPSTGTSLDNATTPFASCYLCHPGQVTKCQRGAMSNVACYNCHGNLTKVGAATRQGWLDLPSCQMCHTGGIVYPTTFDSTGNWRTTADTTFATSPNKPSAGKNLYRYSTGHGGLYCSACHGSQHSEYPTLQANDNLSSTNMQGYTGKIVECTVCHITMPSTQNGGPHGLHTIGQTWISLHKQYAGNGGYTACAYCHGANYNGSTMSAVPTTRTFSVEDSGTKTFSAGHQIGCYDCHNGPNGG
jgi:hypothetical protein